MGKSSRNKKSRTAITGALAVPRQGEAGSKGLDDWYIAEGRRGQQLLEAGHVDQAIDVFESILARFGDAPSYGRAMILGRRGRCFHMGGRPELAIAQLREAMGITEKLALSDGVKSLRGTLHTELGDAYRATSQHDKARKAYEAALKIAQELKDLRSQGVDLGQLGALALTEGKLEEALTHYRSALLLFQQLHEPALEAIAWHQLGAILQEARQWNEAERHYREAARIREERRDLAGAAQTWNQLAILNQEAGKPEAAEGWYRKAIEGDRKIGNHIQAGSHLSNLARMLQNQPGRLVEARQLAEEAQVTAQTFGATTSEIWKAELWRSYGVLAEIIDTEAATTADSQTRAALQAQANDYRQIQRHAPQIVTTLARLGDSPSYGRAVMLERLARCFHMGGRPDLAIAQFLEAIGITEKLVPSNGLKGLRGTLYSELGDMFRATDQRDEARKAYEAAQETAKELNDLWGQSVHSSQLGALALAEGKLEEALTHYRAALSVFQQLHEPALEAVAWHQLGAILQEARQWNEAERHSREAARIREERGNPAAAAIETPVGVGFQVTIYEDLTTHYAFDTDLLIDGRRERKIIRWTEEPDCLGDDVRPMLVPCARNYTDDDGAIHFCLSLREPALERHLGCTVMLRTRREVALRGNPGVLSRLIREMDGARTVMEILSQLSTVERGIATRMLAALAATGVIDVSGRPIAQFLHLATKKGVVPGGGLESDEVLQLATDGTYRAYPEAPRIQVGQSVPDRLRSFYALTRSRRSRRDYRGLTLSRKYFDALLYTACGVTGAMSWGGRQVKLRAYPSSGALYAVEIYPVAFRVEGLEQAVYHYRAVENVLEMIKPGFDHGRIASAALPVEREMVAGASAMICLSGFFSRHERKYGEGGYRMMVAEAGHISQNLILAATALGLSTRPFGGVFDELLNQDLGLDGAEEQFLLAVLIGRTEGHDGR
jgi:SagB-type dehydrogenase family enzyme